MQSVLVVDDNKTIRETLHDLLTYEGFGVQEAADGVQAQTILEAGLIPQAIVLDLAMPIMDGWQLLAWLRTSAYRHVPVIVLTGTFVDADGPALVEKYGCAVLPMATGLRRLVAQLKVLPGQSDAH